MVNCGLRAFLNVGCKWLENTWAYVVWILCYILDIMGEVKYWNRVWDLKINLDQCVVTFEPYGLVSNVEYHAYMWFTLRG